MNKKVLLADALAYLNQIPSSQRADKYSVIVGSYIYLQSKTNLMLTGSEVRNLLKQQGVKIRQVLDFIANIKSRSVVPTILAYVDRVLQSFYSGL